ncbi:MAG: PVC-type heme-binding CxxCH protein [Pirellula sp.]
MSLSIQRLALLVALLASIPATADDFIPRQQTRPPGPPLSPKEALERMVVPEGFRVELVASEPDLLNPVAMAFDDAGRIYVTESFEYPRHEPGPGRDRIKILEDTDGDGKVDKVKIFADGLNIPSGIAVGHGGVWVAHAPDILFLEDTDGDDVSDRSTVVATGFGRDDTHELPNALTWGPDGYLYGLNGVFNRSVVKQDDRTYDFTCAMFRIHPKTRRFELFCEGTSNPWGIAFDGEGSAFVSACVIDHLWHLTESAYYLRQGGPYPPHTWWAESIVKHRHQMAAYCGIEYFDSEAYPESYRKKLYMGNIHGGCINVDRIERSGSTYAGSGEPDFLTANDVWFMPVAQKVGPDGCLYVLDWYDRYHCYQDASADPKGVDRGHGRLYRVVYGERPKARYANLAALSEEELVQALSDSNVYVRQRAQIVLSERASQWEPKTLLQLERIASSDRDLEYRLRALWTLASASRIDTDLLRTLMTSDVPELRAWSVRIAGDRFPKDTALANQIVAMAKDADPRVALQVAIAAPKFAPQAISSRNVVQTEIAVLRNRGEDPLLPRVVWQNLKPFSDAFDVELQTAILGDGGESNVLRSMAPRFGQKWSAAIARSLDDDASKNRTQSLLKWAAQLANTHPDLAADAIAPLAARVRNRELDLAAIQSIYAEFLASVPAKVREAERPQSRWEQEVLIAKLISRDDAAGAVAQTLILDSAVDPKTRSNLLRFAALHPNRLPSIALQRLLSDLGTGQALDTGYRDTVIDLGIANASAEDIERMEAAIGSLKPELQASIAERMCQREPTATALLQWVADGKLRKELLSPNRVRLLATSGSESAKSLVGKVWGTVNTEGSREREEVIQRVTNQLRWDARGSAERGWVVYERICGQCHVMHGRGVEVGPNITANGRGSYEQLLVSVFHPSLVIGDAYRSVTLRTDDGTVVTGLLVARDETKTVVKVQGGKEVTVLASEIETFQQDKKSLMPEGIENQLSPQELADLFALLTLEKAPGIPDNAILSGTPPNLHQPKTK